MNSAGEPEFGKNFPISPIDTCSYYADRLSRVRYAVTRPGFITPSIVDAFTNWGFRRSGDLYYNTICPQCRSCIPYRIPLSGWKPTQSQARNLKKNAHLDFQIQEYPMPTTEKEELYLRYIRTCHPEMVERSNQIRTSAENDRDPSEGIDTVVESLEILETMYSQMYSNTDSSWELEVYDQGKLIGFGILDHGETSLSAVYNVYEPEYRSQGLGIYMIAQSISWAKTQTNFHHYHLGLLIPNHPKMDYKKQFGPGEILHPIRREWVDAKEIF